jgi:hypothetical protein
MLLTCISIVGQAHISAARKQHLLRVSKVKQESLDSNRLFLQISGYLDVRRQLRMWRRWPSHQRSVEEVRVGFPVLEEKKTLVRNFIAFLDM